MLLNNQWITEEIKEEIEKYLETNENKNTMILRKNNRTGEIMLPGLQTIIQSYSNQNMVLAQK